MEEKEVKEKKEEKEEKEEKKKKKLLLTSGPNKGCTRAPCGPKKWQLTGLAICTRKEI